MTARDQQPPGGQPPAVGNIPVQVGTGVAPGPDGQPWVQIQITVGLTMFVMLVPEVTCEELSKIMAKDLATAAATCRRAKLGLILPDSGQQLPPLNGGRPT